MKIWPVNPLRLAVAILCLWFVAMVVDRVSKNYISFSSGPEAFRACPIDALLKETYPGAQIYSVDDVYRLNSLATLQNWLAEDETNGAGYVAEFNDCDDFAFALRASAQRAGITIGVLAYQYEKTRIGGMSETVGHVINIYIVLESGRLVIYEINPQNDQVFRRDNPLQEALWIIY